MSVHTVTCPHCSASLKTTADALLNKKIKCLKCGQHFRVSAHELQPSTPAGESHNEGVGLNGTHGSSAKAVVQVAAPYLPPPGTIPEPPPQLTQPAPPRRRRALQLGLVVCILGLLLAVGIGLGAYCIGAFNNHDGIAAATVPDEVDNPSSDSTNPNTPDAPAPEAAPATAKVSAASGKLAPPAAGSRVHFMHKLPPEQQARVDTAIDRGVTSLRKHQQPNGIWDGTAQGRVYPVAYAAIPGLTLLECGVPATDAAVQRAAASVRANSAKLTRTYELSLAILFLDRLRDPSDEKLIRTLALRLVAGQSVHGGWTYVCPILSAPEDQQLLSFLKENPPIPALEPIGPGGLPQVELIQKGRLPDAVLDPISPGQPASPLEPLQKPGGGRTDPLQNPDPGGKRALPDAPPGDPKALLPANPLPGKDKGKAIPNQKPGQLPKALKQPVALPPALHPNLKHLTALHKKGVGAGTSDDNSNTQFAILALWAGRRHEVPMGATLALVNYRFRTSQHGDGSWNYHYRAGAGTPPMTCVGLLGLGCGHGSFKEAVVAAGLTLVAAKGKGAPVVDDPFIQKGLHYLGQHIGTPSEGKKKVPMTNLYYLWSLERVAVMYELNTIGGKDWYAWAAEMLVANQFADGSWQTHSFPGSVPTLDTCLALLILKRANLTRDLSDSLRDYIAITDHDAP